MESEWLWSTLLAWDNFMECGECAKIKAESVC